MNHYPKGGRCMACARREHKCNHLPFHEMPVHRRDGVDVVVICTYFERAPQNDSRAK
jgi:hypothetical protein